MAFWFWEKKFSLVPRIPSILRAERAREKKGRSLFCDTTRAKLGKHVSSYISGLFNFTALLFRFSKSCGLLCFHHPSRKQCPRFFFCPLVLPLCRWRLWTCIRFCLCNFSCSHLLSLPFAYLFWIFNLSHGEESYVPWLKGEKKILLLYRMTEQVFSSFELDLRGFQRVLITD